MTIGDFKLKIYSMTTGYRVNSNKEYGILWRGVTSWLFVKYEMSVLLFVRNKNNLNPLRVLSYFTFTR